VAVGVVEFGRSFFESGGLVAIGGLQFLSPHEIFDELGIDLFLLYFVVVLGDVAVGVFMVGQLID
jgi:hypothetical protein